MNIISLIDQVLSSSEFCTTSLLALVSFLRLMTIFNAKNMAAMRSIKNIIVNVIIHVGTLY